MKIECPEDISHLTAELVAFARRQIVNAVLYRGDERRRRDRHHMMLPVRAVPVDKYNRPCGQPFDLITRDISATSISLLHTEEITDERLGLQFRIAGDDVNVVIDIVWSEPLGPFYGAGGEFRDKLAQFPG